MLKIGLTGGIGSGNSSGADGFLCLGVETLDADLIARELVAPGQPTLVEIAALFGPQLILEDGSLDRPRLARRVFESPEARERLEQLLHPRVYATMAARMETFAGPYCILEIPLLVETRQQGFVDRVLVVDSPERLRIARIKTRTGLDDSAVAKILATQASRAERMASAADLIVNSCDLAPLRDRIASLDRFYRSIATARNQAFAVIASMRR
ncbi:MAG: dephospho-CoA kinase [Methylococcaceae bacterium]|nr:dephospho-CoA kinase [Methylococcaceae bacterium]